MKWITEVMEENANRRQKEFIKNFNSKLMDTSSIPRRMFIDKLTIAEKAIFNAMEEVEKLDADVRLTDAINLLSQAKDKVSDYVDDIK